LDIYKPHLKKKEFFLLACLWALENYLHLETEFQTNLKIKTWFCFSKSFPREANASVPIKNNHTSAASYNNPCGYLYKYSNRTF
jgi:hypothetical protein